MMAGFDELYTMAMAADVAADGTGTSNQTPMLKGMLWGFYVTYHASLDAGTDVTIKAVLSDGTEITLLTLTNNKTSGLYPVRLVEKKADGTDGTGATYYALTDDRLYFTVAGGGAPAIADAVKVYAKII